jgi:SM-20-related protein
LIRAAPAPRAPASSENFGGLPLWCRIENLLTPADCEELLRDTLSVADGFGPSRTLTSASGHRRSSILFRNPQFLKDFVEVIRRCLPVVTPALGISPFEPSRITAQVTAHHDGDFYRVHRDDGHPDVRHRTVSFAFYFHREPRQFEGGELVLYEYDAPHDQVGTSASVVVAPHGNTIVFFPSRTPHEVRPIASASARFEAARFAINGWVSR